MKEDIATPIKYCLYARKSSESDEKQAMSIKGQLMEMRQQAKKEKIVIIEEITESHSAKQTGQRPQFNYMIEMISQGKYNAIITWAPDRISRNAGDLGRIVDLMDQGKLLFIQTHTQTFSNNPNEKFLLMILCSQAKLENDNRGIMNKSEEEVRLTPHNTKKSKAEITEEQNQMLKEYLLHILQFGTPEERKKILGGIKSKFKLSDRKLILK